MWQSVLKEPPPAPAQNLSSLPHSGLSSWSSCLSIVPFIRHDLNAGHVYHLIVPSQELHTVPTQSPTVTCQAAWQHGDPKLSPCASRPGSSTIRMHGDGQ